MTLLLLCCSSPAAGRGQARPDIDEAVAVLQDIKLGPIARIKAARALGRLGPLAAAAVPNLARVLRERDEDLVVVASETLGRIGAGAIPALVQALALEQERRGHPFARALGKIGAEAIPALAAALKSNNETVDSVAKLVEGIPNHLVVGLLMREREARLPDEEI